MRLLLLLTAIIGLSANARVSRAAEPISFNKQIRPILADRCFKCHGPDTAARKAGLRLDREAIAKGKLEDSGNISIVPGKPQASELIARLTHDDLDQVMPPPDSKLAVSKQEIELIRRWIAQGAKWERHWAFIAPRKSDRPAVADQDWPIHPIDHFILHRLESEGLAPSPEADKERWLRRVTFDLTGLPPTIAELDAFLKDATKSARETVVDRLLQSPAFGERMALEWLDAARYGDTDGLFEDHPRLIYPWRDWVVRAFNDNLSFRDFITFQLAGDLLPNATMSQRVATGFIRNNTTSNEGGIIGEDYRIKYLVDRVNTTATSMLGLTLECAQCHDHKYDPMTQREYYQFAGFFNSLVGNGNTKGATAPTIRVYTNDQSARIQQIDVELAKIETKLKSNPPQLTAEFEGWLRMLSQPLDWRPLPLAENNSWRVTDGWLVEARDTKPKADSGKKRPTMRGRFVRVALPKGGSGFLTISEVQVFSSGRNIATAGKATQSSVDYASPAKKAIDGNRDGSFRSCSCTKSEKDAWWEVDLGAAFPIESVAVWNRTDCCPERLDRISIDILDENRKPVARRVIGKAAPRNTLPANAPQVTDAARELRLTLLPPPGPIAALRLESKLPTAIELVKAQLSPKGGNEKTKKDLRLLGNKKLNIKGQPVLLGVETIVAAPNERLELTFRGVSLGGLRITAAANPTASIRATLPKEREKRLAHFRGRWAGFSEARKQKASLSNEKKQIDSKAALTMIAADTPKPRTNYLLIRGEYDKRGEVVQTAALGSIMPYDDKLPNNRLGLARWLTDPANPLTARVAVNRYWQMIFGTGLVKTSEDFGTQGDPPSHQELLDYLAVEFVDSGWDVKKLIRAMVLSATYRQASFQTEQVRIRDPDNRLLSHATRRRLQAEFLRDHALATSGLLNRRRGGPGVNPYQPAVLFGANAIGAAGTKFSQSSGDDLYRRSIYTYWKRQIPAANMRIFGSDGRTTCRTRRESTNTPLQALVLLNDPQFVEAARVLAERVMREGGAKPAERLSFAFRLATSRRVSKSELAILLQEYNDRLNEFQADTESARKYLAGGGQRKADKNLDPAQLAAYAAVCSLIMNLDESISLG